MELEFTWIDALMITLVFITLGLMSGKKEYDKKVAKEEENSNE